MKSTEDRSLMICFVYCIALWIVAAIVEANGIHEIYNIYITRITLENQQ